VIAHGEPTALQTACKHALTCTAPSPPARFGTYSARPRQSKARGSRSNGGPLLTISTSACGDNVTCTDATRDSTQSTRLAGSSRGPSPCTSPRYGDETTLAWRSPTAYQAAAIALLACLATFLAFEGGGDEHYQPGITVLRGVAYVGDDEASVAVGGWVYRISRTGNITWVDSQGRSMRMAGQACLLGPGRCLPVTRHHQHRHGTFPASSPGTEA
jgi:hypothetical protein